MSGLPPAQPLAQVIADCAVSDPLVRAQIPAYVRVESGGDPLALNLNPPKGSVATPIRVRVSSAANGVQIARAYLARGWSADAGLMQVNFRSEQRGSLALRDAFDPCANMREGSAILQESLRFGFRMAASYYNTGTPTAGIANGYARKIEAALAGPATAGPSFTIPSPAPAPTPPERDCTDGDGWHITAAPDACDDTGVWHGGDPANAPAQAGSNTETQEPK